MGWQTVAFVERDQFCQQVLAKNFGAEIPIYDDIFTFSFEKYKEDIWTKFSRALDKRLKL